MRALQILAAALLVIGAKLTADPVSGGACTLGTLDEYVALGSTGCYFPDGTLLNDVIYSVVGSPSSIVPSNIGESQAFINENGVDFWQMQANFPELISVVPGEVLQVSMQGTLTFDIGAIKLGWVGVVNDSHLGGVQCFLCYTNIPSPPSVYPFPSSVTFGFDSSVADVAFGVANYSGMDLDLQAVPAPPTAVPEPSRLLFLVTAVLIVLVWSRSRRATTNPRTPLPAPRSSD